MKDLKSLAVGVVGAGGVELAQYVQIPEIDQTGSSVSIVIQIIIGIAALFKMLKKQKGV